MTCHINSCKKKTPYAIESPVFTGSSCGTCQKVKGARNGATAWLCAQIEGKEVSHTAFTDVMENLIAKVHLSINDTSDNALINSKLQHAPRAKPGHLNF